jgi:hypothetical protein
MNQRPLVIRVIESLLAWSPVFLIPVLIYWWRF